MILIFILSKSAKNLAFIGILFLFFTSSLRGQNKRIFLPEQSTELEISDTDLEKEWNKISPISGFINHFPVDSGLAIRQVAVKIRHEPQTLVIRVDIPHPSSEFVIQSMKRDNTQGIWGSDAFAVILDPMNKKTNGFFFGVNARGAQMEGLISMQGNGVDFDTNWDNRWSSEVKSTSEGWSLTLGIPFKTLRFQVHQKIWGINFIHINASENIRSVWNPVPVNINVLDLGFTGSLVWEKPPGINNQKLSVIPYLASGVNQNYLSEGKPQGDFAVGTDAKIGISSSLNLDLTLNPDFSQVDVDRQVTNLTRFNLFFPERRNFFLENSDLFSQFGRFDVRPFFSRRIGLNEGVPIPILFGARLSGNLSAGSRIGLMNVQTKAMDELTAQNYAVLSFQQRFFSRSSLKGIFVNRQGEENSDFNRVAGLEVNYLSKNGKWNSEAQYYRSFQPATLSNQSYFAGTFQFNTRALNGGIIVKRLEDNFQADVGFTPRLFNYDPLRDAIIRHGYTEIYGGIEWALYPDNKQTLTFHGPELENVHYLNNDGSLNERNTAFSYEFDFANQSQFDLGISQFELNLRYPLALLGDEFEPLPAQRYLYNSFFLDYDSDPRKSWAYGAVIDYGTFYNGKRLSMNSYINYRDQPWGNFGFRINYNRVILPSPYGKANLLLVGTQVEIAFSNRMFWTTFLQYNTQSENFNINSRFQWRFKPMSDLFIVYSDNYTTDDLSVTQRGIVLKLTYWINI
ncbi:MAG: DUF5916 domain-containing protein [Bacteroidota bacterium]